MKDFIKKNKKKAINLLIFCLIMFLTLYAVLHGQNLPQLWSAVRSLSAPYLCLALAAALFFVSAEGVMIWYLLRPLHGKSGVLRCICYSFIGFFYSGITPSATGGQPMQLYYMKKDGNSLADSSVVLMTVALIYKLVLVFIGTAMLIFWYQPLKVFLDGYFGLYLLGLFLNVILVLLLLTVMAAPGMIQKAAAGLERIFIGCGFWKESAARQEKVRGFIGGYQEAVLFLRKHKGRIAFVIWLTFLQRCSLFVLTYFIYRGFSLQGTDMATVVLLQAAVYVAVDMLPLPGAQGITELMYQGIFGTVFTGLYLTSSLCVTRGINFYFPLLVSLLIVVCNQAVMKRRKAKAA